MEFAFDGYEWDEQKARSNEGKHKIAFEDAIQIFRSVVHAISTQEDGEERWIATGQTQGREITVVFTERQGRCRVISARKASREERQDYYSSLGSRS
jgi:uncharacterized DUF497 family protein